MAGLPTFAWLALLVVAGVVAVVAVTGSGDDNQARDSKSPTKTHESTDGPSDSKTDSTIERSAAKPGAKPVAVTVDPASTSTDVAPESTEDQEPSDTVDDHDALAQVSGCVVLDAKYVKIDLTNSTEKLSSYSIDVELVDGAGTVLGEDSAVYNYVRPGEKVSEPSLLFDTLGATGCNVTAADRLDIGTPSQDFTGSSCVVTRNVPTSMLGTDFTLVNNGSAPADFHATAAVVVDGVRVGSASAVMRSVPGGASHTDIGISSTNGLGVEATCEIVYLG